MTELMCGVGMQVDWEAVSAIGTLAAVILALGIALRDSWRKRQDQKSAAQLAAVMLWPDVRRLLAAVSATTRHEVMDAIALFPQQKDELRKILVKLAFDSDHLSPFVRDLHGEQRDWMARALANAAHLRRHASDIAETAAVLPRPNLRGKQTAMRLAADDARRNLVKMSNYIKPLIANTSDEAEEG